ncbi:UNVERIFIED_CONTAM: hypothetical protein NCL1_25036 [Trichonephila clavipes]
MRQMYPPECHTFPEFFLKKKSSEIACLNSHRSLRVHVSQLASTFTLVDLMQEKLCSQYRCPLKAIYPHIEQFRRKYLHTHGHFSADRFVNAIALDVFFTLVSWLQVIKFKL